MQDVPKSAWPAISVETVTPKRAELWQKLRRPSASVRLLAESMLAGGWHLNGEALCFDEDGLLVDGAKRLLACQLTGLSFETLVVRGISADAFRDIDTGRPRRPAPPGSTGIAPSAPLRREEGESGAGEVEAISARFCWVHPADARRMLARAASHRNLQESLLARYERDMRSSSWSVTHQGLKFAGGVLVDGRHRLASCMRAGVSFPTLIVNDVPAPHAHGTHTRRSYSLALAQRQEKAPAELARELRDTWRTSGYPGTPTAAELDRVLMQFSTVAGGTETLRSLARLRRRMSEA